MYNSFYRAFTEEYRTYLDTQRGGWPPNKVLERWFKEVCGYQGGTNTAMRRGTPVPDKYLKWFVELLVTSADRLDLRQARLATLDFVARFEIRELTPASADAVLEHICLPPISRPEGKEAAIDYLRRRTIALNEFIHLASFDSWVRGCPTECIEEAVRWVYVRVAQCNADTGPMMSSPEAITYSTSFIGLKPGDYAARVAQWATSNPWTVVRAWHKVGGVGVNITLPVTPHVYQRVLDGDLAPTEITPHDFDLPSLHIILEAIAEKPEFVGRPHVNPTRSLRASSIFQIAALARCNRLPGPAKLRILSFAGTPLNELRLRDVGFLPTGGRLRHPRSPKLYELTVDVGQLLTRDLFTVGALELIGARCPSSPRMDDG